MALIRLDSNNWEEITNSSNCILILGTSKCSNCREWIGIIEKEVENGFAKDYIIAKVILDNNSLVQFKMKNSWINQIDIFPHTAIISEGKRISFMSGKSIERLQEMISNSS